MIRIERILLIFSVVVTLMIGACGGDDAPAASDNGNDVGDRGGPPGEAELVVPRDYLQGGWCDSDGQSWTIEGDTARFEDSSGGAGQLPVDLVFIDDVDNELISQTDDEFVAVLAGDEITFSRGTC